MDYLVILHGSRQFTNMDPVIILIFGWSTQVSLFNGRMAKGCLPPEVTGECNEIVTKVGDFEDQGR